VLAIRANRPWIVRLGAVLMDREMVAACQDKIKDPVGGRAVPV